MGRFDTLSDEAKERLDTIKKMFEDLGFVQFEFSSYADNSCVKFRRKGENAKTTYVGTFFNRFSNGDPVELWADEEMWEDKYIVVENVYRRNGAPDNTSLDIKVAFHHCTGCTYYVDDTIDAVDAEKRNQCRVDHEGGRVNIGRVLKTSGVKAIAKRVAAAIECYDKIELADHIALAKNREDYHKSTKEEYAAWQDSELKRLDEERMKRINNKG